MTAAVAVGSSNCISFQRNIGHSPRQMNAQQIDGIQTELADREEPEPVFDEFILAKQAEAAMYEDQRIRAVTAMQQRQAESDERETFYRSASGFSCKLFAVNRFKFEDPGSMFDLVKVV
jgi:hypothetical protein